MFELGEEEEEEEEDVFHLRIELHQPGECRAKEEEVRGAGKWLMDTAGHKKVEPILPPKKNKK